MPSDVRRPRSQAGLKWVIALLVLACMGFGVYLVARTKMQTGQTPVSRQLTPSDLVNGETLNSEAKISIHWEKPQGGQVQGEVTNVGPEMLPNLYIQFLVSNGSADQWLGPYHIQYQPPGQQAQDAIPPNTMVPFTVPVDLTAVSRLHAYFLNDTPAGPVQYGVQVEQSEDRD